jgi:RES domain-containing protein
MEVFRITKAKYAGQLYASGVEGRWNNKGEEVIYAAHSRSLACLENLVHKSGLGSSITYRTMVIYIPDELLIQQISLQELPEGWNEISLNKVCQQLGSRWFTAKDAPVLKVPSAVIPTEFNYVINSRHPHFSQIKLIESVPFFFDRRLLDALGIGGGE